MPYDLNGNPVEVEEDGSVRKPGAVARENDTQKVPNWFILLVMLIILGIIVSIPVLITLSAQKLTAPGDPIKPAASTQDRVRPAQDNALDPDK